MAQIRKTDGYDRCLSIIEGLPKGEKPKLLLHACCAPCSAYPLLFLSPHFRITLYYQNSNIYPEGEYDKRLEEVLKLLDYIERDYGYEIGLVAPSYDHEKFMEPLREYADCKEGGKRCEICLKARMEEGYRYASANGYPYFATLMSISSRKDAVLLNKIGEELEKGFPNTKYLYNDFKKAQGADIALRLRKHYKLYSQDYCGCEYSLAESGKEHAK